MLVGVQNLSSTSVGVATTEWSRVPQLAASQAAIVKKGCLAAPRFGGRGSSLPCSARRPRTGWDGHASTPQPCALGSAGRSVVPLLARSRAQRALPLILIPGLRAGSKWRPRRGAGRRCANVRSSRSRTLAGSASSRGAPPGPGPKGFRGGPPFPPPPEEESEGPAEEKSRLNSAPTTSAAASRTNSDNSANGS